MFWKVVLGEKMAVGMDIIEIQRFERVNKNPSLLSAIFTKEEILYVQQNDWNTSVLSNIFAIKEAVSKALGCGFSQGVSPLDIEVSFCDKVVKVNLLRNAKKIFEQKGFKKIDVSVSNGFVSIAICQIL